MSDCIAVREAEYRGDYRIWVRFSDGQSGEADLESLVFSHPAATALRSPERFARFYLDSWPTIARDCGFDISPESLYERAIGARTSV